jgi:hypothetical protein
MIPLVVSLSLYDLLGWIFVGFVLGVLAATWLYLTISSGFRVKITHTREVTRPCP